MALRFLIIEGNTREVRERAAAGYGRTPSQSYAAAVQEIAPEALCDIAFPADEGANLPDPAGLESYDAVFVTGSALNVYDLVPAVTRQIELMRAVYESGVPSFGSCWGIQVAAVAAGGEVRVNPAGREVGFARNIAPTEAGRAHPVLAGRPAAFAAPASHIDTVTALPGDAVPLASNGMSTVQAAEIRYGGGVFWGVQYHPEYTLAELAALIEWRAPALTAEGLFTGPEDAAAYVADLRALDREPSRRDLAWRHGLDAEVLDPVRRRRELRNFIAHRVLPTRSARGRS
jgi:GMP synthase (glutamine-hydrolysing)